VKIAFQLKIKKPGSTVAKGNPNKQKGSLKQKFAKLTDDDLIFEEGKKDEK
jgi:uncharacterized protein YjbJ (UPF0337 family)